MESVVIRQRRKARRCTVVDPQITNTQTPLLHYTHAVHIWEQWDKLVRTIFVVCLTITLPGGKLNENSSSFLFDILGPEFVQLWVLGVCVFFCVVFNVIERMLIYLFFCSPTPDRSGHTGWNIKTNSEPTILIWGQIKTHETFMAIWIFVELWPILSPTKLCVFPTPTINQQIKGET